MKIGMTGCTKIQTYRTHHSMTPRQVKMVLAGSLINLVKKESD